MSRPPSLDERVKQAASAPRSAIERARAAALSELAQTPRARGWRSEWALWVGVLGTVVLAVALGGVAFGFVDAGTAADRSPGVLGLLSVGAVCAYGALTPRSRAMRGVGLLAGAVGLLGVVLARTHGMASPLPEWVCTVSQVAVAIGPGVVALSLLRRRAPHPVRAALAGLSVGAVGAMVGELACNQSRAHVATYHVGAWLLVVAVSMVVGRFLRSESYAP